MPEFSISIHSKGRVIRSKPSPILARLASFLSGEDLFV